MEEQKECEYRVEDRCKIIGRTPRRTLVLARTSENYSACIYHGKKPEEKCPRCKSDLTNLLKGMKVII